MALGRQGYRTREEMPRDAYSVLWVCRDCLCAYANGEDYHEPGQPEPWTLHPDTRTVSMGIVGREHTCGPTPDCDCERREFSKTACDGCGSALAGERHAFTLWR